MYEDLATSSPPAARAKGTGGPLQTAHQELLAFKLGGEEYGIDILRVQEIRGFEPVTRIANTPAHMLGVINLRGTIVPIVDLRIKFNHPKVSYDALTVVIILNLHGRIVGIVVDGVSDVLTLEEGQIQAPPEFAASLDVRYITGLGTPGERMLILVDIERLIGSAEMQIFEPRDAA